MKKFLKLFSSRLLYLFIGMIFAVCATYVYAAWSDADTGGSGTLTEANWNALVTELAANSGGGSPYIDWNDCYHKSFGPTTISGFEECDVSNDYILVDWSATCSGADSGNSEYCYAIPVVGNENRIFYSGHYEYIAFNRYYNYVSGGIKCCKYIIP